MTRYLIKLIHFFVGIAISLYSIIFFLDFLPSDYFNIINQNILALISIFFILMPIYFLRAYKYSLIINNKKEYFQNALCLFISLGFNNFLPFRFGDVIRIGFVKKFTSQNNYFKIISSIILEKIYDLISIVFLLFLLTIFFNKLFFFFYDLINFKYFLFILICSFLILLIISRSFKIKKFFHSLFMLDQIKKSQHIKILLISITHWILEIFLLATIVSLFIYGEFISLTLLSLNLSNLATLIPSAPGYIGTFDLVGLLPFEIYNLNTSHYSIFIIIVHIGIWLFSSIFSIISYFTFHFFFKT